MSGLPHHYSHPEPPFCVRVFPMAPLASESSAQEYTGQIQEGSRSTEQNSKSTGTSVKRKRGRPKKGEEKSQERTPVAELAEERASTSQAVEDGKSRKKVERKGRPKKGEEKSQKVSEGADTSSSSKRDTSITIEGALPQKEIRRGRPKKGQEENKALHKNVDKSNKTTNGKKGKAKASSNKDAMTSNEGEGVIPPEASNESSEKGQKGVQPAPQSQTANKQVRKKRKVNAAPSSDVIESEAPIDGKERQEKLGGNVIMSEEQHSNLGYEGKEVDATEVTPADRSTEIANSNVSLLASEKRQRPVEDVEWTIKSLPDNSMLSETKKGRPASLHLYSQKTASSQDLGNPDSGISSKARMIAGQVQTILADGRAGYTTITTHDSNANGRSASEKARECYMGPVQAQKLQSFPTYTSRKLSELVDDEGKPGSLLNAGGHIYSLDWLHDSDENSSTEQFLCISASNEVDPRTLIGEKVAPFSSSPGQVQIWSINEKVEAKIDFILAFTQGRILSVRWVPLLVPIGEARKVLGLLSVCMQDGTVGIYVVPRPSEVQRKANDVPTLRLDPLIQLDVNKGIATCLAWCNADKLAVAYSDGWVSIWSLAKCLKAGTSRARPNIFAKVSTAPISCISWDSNGQRVFVSAYDGSTQCMQLAHPNLSTTLYHSRDVCYAVEYSDSLGMPLMERADIMDVRSINFVDGKMSAPHFYSHLGRVRSLALSQLHPYVASGGADGSVRVLDTRDDKNARKSRKVSKKLAVMTIFRLDRHRGNGSFRMLENFALLPTSYQAKHATASTVAWDPAISLTATRWNPNVGKEDWLVSGTACGLVRIDVVSAL